MNTYCPNCGMLAASVDDHKTLHEQIESLRKSALAAIECLESNHVQKNLYRMGALGLYDVSTALQTLKNALK